jgi:hypothetical protein
MNLIRFAAGAAIALTAIVSLAPAADAATVPTQTYTLNTVSNPHQVGRADVQFRAHTERISVTLDEGGLPAGDYTVKIVASAAGQVTVLDFQTKTVCTFTCPSGSGVARVPRMCTPTSWRVDCRTRRSASTAAVPRTSTTRSPPRECGTAS